jgi:hypothetical protein
MAQEIPIEELQQGVWAVTWQRIRFPVTRISLRSSARAESDGAEWPQP